MLDDKIIKQHIAQASALVTASLPKEEHSFSPAAEAKTEKLFEKYRWFEWRQTAKRPMKKAAAVAIALLVFGFSGTMTVQANRRRAVETIVRVFEHYISSEEEAPPAENPAIYTIEFGWLPDRMYETERIESEDFYYILFQTGDPDYPLEDAYVAFFLKKLEPTGSSKITGTRPTGEDLEQMAVDLGAERLEAILSDRHDMQGWSTTRERDKYGDERYMIYIRISEQGKLSQGGGTLGRICDNLIFK